MGLKNIFIWFCTTTGFAQIDQPGSDYYEKFEGKLSAQLFYLSTANEFSFNDDAFQYAVIPNIKETIGVSVQYDIISFSYGYAPRFFAINRDNQHSKMTSFNINFFPGKWVQHLDYYHQKGVTIEADAYDYSRYFERVATTKIGGNTSYVFNDNFSFKSIFFQNERQLKSTGSFVPGLYYYYTDLNVHGTAGLESGHYFDVALSPAYYYNWVIAKHFLASGGVAFGLGVNYSVDSDTHLTSLLYHGKLNIALGYNSERFFCGANVKALYFEHQSDDTLKVDDIIGYSTLFVGYRFDAPPFLARQENKAKGLIGL